MAKPSTSPPGRDRRAQPRENSGRWQSALTSIAPNKILIRGYPLDEMMGRLGFAEAVYLLLMGELPTPAIGRMLNAVLVSSIDHGVTPPSTLAARSVATSGAPLKDCVASGILAFGPHHGGDIESCMLFLDKGLSLVRGGKTLQQAAETIVDECLKEGVAPPGFGHRYHSRDPRAGRLFQMALELELEGEHVRLIRAAERVAMERQEEFGRPLPVNVDGAIAAISADLGFAYELGNAIFLISRMPGLIAHAHEERTRQAPMRQIDPKDYEYDGAGERRLPQGRK
ncbi:MAG TPA: citryl-CoA lyase [Vicinamibacterales bacterium]|nr:citryl-CoA lyase [Vicinamibacterales bacterium]